MVTMEADRESHEAQITGVEGTSFGMDETYHSASKILQVMATGNNKTKYKTLTVAVENHGGQLSDLKANKKGGSWEEKGDHLTLMFKRAPISAKMTCTDNWYTCCQLTNVLTSQPQHDAPPVTHVRPPRVSTHHRTSD